ncbi:zinc ribbon domain-containing protein [[Eubacterium] cellulosolvens]
MAERKEILTKMKKQIDTLTNEDIKPLFCPECGYRIESQEAFCIKCGVKISEGKPSIKVKRLFY